MKGLKRKFRRGLAGFLSFVLTMTSFNMVSWADVTEAFEKENATFIMSGEDLKESAQAAIDEGNIFDFEDLSLETSDRSLAKEYEKLFTAGSVYEIAPTYDMDDEECADGAELRLFVRVDDAYEGYQLTGDEDIIFLYVNDSTSRVTFRSFIDGYYTKKVTVKGNSSLFETTVPGTPGGSNGGVAGDAQVPEGNGGNPGEVTDPDSNVAGDAVQNPDSNADSDGNVTNPDDSVDNNVQNPEENNDADENGANSEENKGDEIQNPTGNSGSDENITDPSETPGSDENVTNPDKNTDSDDEVTVPEGNDGSGDKVTPPSGNTDSDDKVTVPEENTNPDDKVTSPSENTGSEDNVTNPDKNDNSDNEVTVPEGNTNSEDKGSTPETNTSSETNGTDAGKTDTSDSKSDAASTDSHSSNSDTAKEEKPEDSASDKEKTTASLSRHNAYVLMTADTDNVSADDKSTTDNKSEAVSNVAEGKSDEKHGDVVTDSNTKITDSPDNSVDSDTENKDSADNTENSDNVAITDGEEGTSDVNTQIPEDDSNAIEEGKDNITTDGSIDNGDSHVSNVNISDFSSDLDDDDSEVEDNVVIGSTSGRTYGQVVLDESYYAKAYVTTLNQLHIDVSAEGYEVTYTVEPVGTATVYGAKSVSDGKDLTFTVKPQFGYVIENVTANGESLEADEKTATESSADTGEKHYTVFEVKSEQEIVVSMAETGEHPEFNYSKTLGDVVVSLHAEEGILPAGTVARVTEVTEKVEEAVKEKAAEETGEDTSSNTVLAYDIKLFIENEDGELVELDNSWSESGYVEVSFTGKAIEEKSAESDTVEVSHVDIGEIDAASEDVEKVAAEEVQSIESVAETIDVSGDNSVPEVMFEAEHFSTYAIIFSYYNKTEIKATIKTVDIWGTEIGNSRYPDAGGNKYTFKKGDQKDISDIVKGISFNGYYYVKATPKNSPNVLIKSIRRNNDVLQYQTFDSWNWENLAGDEIYIWYDLEDTINVKVYSRYNGLIDKQYINTNQTASDFGPAGNDSPYVTVTIKLKEMVKALREKYPDFRIWYNGEKAYISVVDTGISGDGTYEEQVKALYSDYIYQYMTEESKKDIRNMLGDQYYGYVLKCEGTWHIDGYFGNEYTLEIYYKNNDVTNPEHVKGSSSAESYSYVTDYIEKSLGADVVWGPITPFGQEGVYKKDGTSYKVNITFGMDKHPIKVFDYQTPIQYYKMTSEGRGDKYISQFTYSVIRTTNDEPDTPTITVKKVFDGLTEAEIDNLVDNYQIKLKGGDIQGTAVLKLNDYKVKKEGSDKHFTYTWIINNLYAGTYEVSEDGEELEEYDVVTTYNGSGSGNSVTTTGPQISFGEPKRYTDCSENDYVIGKVNLIVARLTEKAGLFVWSADRLTGSERKAVIDLINDTSGFKNSADMNNCFFFSGDNLLDQDGLTFRNATVRYDGEKNMHFDDPDQWTQFFTGTYEVSDPDNAEITIQNTYTRQVGSLTIRKSLAAGSEAVEIPKDVTFNVYQKAASGEGVLYKSFKYSDMTNGSLTLEVPTGDYYVTEGNYNIESYDCTVSGEKVSVTVSKGNNSEINITNKYTKQTGNIGVTKQVTVNGNPTTGTLADGTYYFALYDSNGVNLVQGQDILAINITNGQEASGKFNDVPVGNYQVYEVTVGKDGTVSKGAPVGMTLISENGQSVTVTKGSENSVIFTNNRVVSGSVHLIKTDNGTQRLPGAKFSLSMKINGEYQLVDNGENGIYVTNASGEINISGLAFGEYKLEEVEPPVGYQLGAKNWYAEFEVNDQKQNFEFNVTNERALGSVQVTKVDEDGNGLSGAVFRLYAKKTQSTGIKGFAEKMSNLLGIGNDYEIYGDYQVGPNGELTIPNLPWNDYILVELKAPEGYQLSSTEYPFTIKADNLKPELGVGGKISNTKLTGSARLIKTDESGNTKLSGAKFELYRVSEGTEELIGIYETKGNGETELISNLFWGKYYFKEVKAPDNYILPDAKVKLGEFEINAQNVTQIQEVTVKNKLMTGNLLLKKTFDGKTVAEAIENKLITADELSEVSFNVYRQTGTTPDIKNDELVTQEALQLRADGTLEYGPLTVGKYYVKEASAPAAYPVSDTLYPFEITAENYNSKYLMTVDNTKIVKSVEFTKVDASDGTGVSGARFTLYKKDVNGEYKPYGDAYISNEYGQVMMTGLGAGAYYFVETSNTGYEVPKTEYYFEISQKTGETVEIHTGSPTGTIIVGSKIENTRKTASVILTKTDKDSKNVLSGAEFSLYRGEANKEENLIASGLVTDEKGRLTAADYEVLSDLPWAIYYFVETKAPEGYKLNSTPIRFEVERETFSNGETTVNVSAENEKYYADVKLKKVFKKLNEESAGNLEALFDLYKVESGKEDILIASNLKSEEGVVKYSGLGTGSYYFIETSAPDGYSIELVNGQPKKYTFTVTVPDNNERVTVDAGMAVNTRNPGTVEIEKLNESYQNTPMSNVTFKLYRVDSIVTETELEPIITGNDGTGRQSGLEWGSYYLQEVTPEGYIVNNHKYDFTISADNLTASFTGDKAIKNSVITGNVVLNKKDKTSGADLSGVEFELYRGTSPDGVLVQTDKALVTDSKGQITLNGLEYGSYYFKEKTAKQGYQLSDTVIPFTINENGKTVTVAAENERLLGSVVITKQDELTGSVLAGAEFTLYSQTDRREMNPIMKALTGMNDDYHVYREGLKTDADGILKIENLPWDNYYLIETKAPQGYTLDSNTRYAFTIDAGKLTGQLNGKTENIITNKKQTGSVTLTKMDADDQGKLLSGAEFELYRRLEDGTAEKVELEHTLLTTDESGSITVKDLDWGKYYFKEIKAPVGYALNPTETEFEITRENVAASIETPIAVTVKDTAFEISVDKVDAETNTSLTGAELKLYHLEDVVAGKPAEDAKPIAVWNSVAGSPQKIGMLINGGSAYVLIETKAPAGYTLAENLIFTVREDGTIETDGTVTDSNIILVQDVKYVPGTLTLTAGKELTGRTLTEGEFEFALKEGDNTIATAVNQADGSINFNLTNYYAETGEHDYTVVEIDNGLSGITYDKTSYAVHVSVKDNNNGGLAAEITYPDGSDGIVFKNVYHATGSLNVTGIKEINGREFKAGDEYTFELLRDKKVVDTITIRPTAGNQAGFVLRDSSLDESDSKMTYSYEVREVLGGQTVSGVTYDGTVYKGDYRINDNGDGTVRADRVNGSDLAEVRFTNTYRTGEAAFTINGIKHMTGRSFRAGDEFTFIAEKDGQPYDTVTIRPESENDAQFAMKTDVYTKADAGKTYTYTVYEQKGTISRVTYSDAVYKIHVSITDDGEGNLNAAAVIDGKAFTTVEFINSYDATSDGDHTGGDGGHNPDSNKPYVPGGPGDLVTVTPDEVPLATAPTGGSPTDDLILIDDGNVPLAGLPKTGDRAAHAGLAAFLSGILLAAFAAIGGRKKEEEDR